MKKGFNRIIYYSFIAVLSSILHVNLSAAPNIVEDFTGPLNLDKYSGVELSKELDTVNENLILTSKGSAFLKSGSNSRLSLSDPNINFLQADLTVKEIGLGNSDTQQAFVRLGGDFYATTEGTVFVALFLGDRGQGIEAWYAVQEYKRIGSTFITISFSQGTLNSSALSLNTPYTSSISYDDNNNFIFTFNNEIPVSVNGPVRVSSTSPYKFVGTRVRFGQKNATVDIFEDAKPDDGSVAFVNATVDNVITSTSTPAIFDDFSALDIDYLKWNDDEAFVEIVNQQLVMKAKSQTSGRASTNLRFKKSNFNYLSSKITILNSTVWNPGTRIRGRLQYYVGNDTYNVDVGDNFNGFEGDIYSHISLERNTDGSFRIQIYIGRADNADYSAETDLFFTSIYPTTPISYGDTFEFAIERVGSLVNYKVNGVTEFTFDPHDITAYPALSGNVYPASDSSANGIQSRVQNGPGEAYIQFDDLTISDESDRNIVKRAEVAQSLLRAKYGKTYTPPAASGTLYNDILASEFNAGWIEQLAVDGITEGCANNNFCPNMVVTKEQLAKLVLKAKYGETYVPPSATNNVFADVAGDFTDWIEELANQGLSVGCDINKFCPKEAVTFTGFEDMLVRAFPALGSLTVITPDLPLSNSDVERQVFFSLSGNVAATYFDNGTGIVYSNDGGSGPGSDSYNWLISNNVLTISQAGEADFTYTVKNIEGNKYTFYNSDLQRNEIYYRGLPFSISDLDGIIYDLDITDDPDCSAATIKFNGNTASLKEVCTGGNLSIPMTVTSATDLDNTLILNFTDPEDSSALTSRLVITEGTVESSVKIAIIENVDSVFSEIFTDTWTITDVEAF